MKDLNVAIYKIALNINGPDSYEKTAIVRLHFLKILRYMFSIRNSL